jgi:polysaccharide pyruvyl transferase WcaK-like protein
VSAHQLRVGFFGLLGQGNLGNDGSLEAMLAFVRDRHPDADIDVLCSHPAEITRRYGLRATRLHWNRHEYESARNAGAIATKILGKLVDPVRIAAWVREHDVVFVPGMGVLESVPPLRPWGFPYSLFLLSATGKLQRTWVGMISVGADRSIASTTRWVVGKAASMAAYRSFRDAPSRAAMQSMGVDTSRDVVCPDLVFALPHPEPPEAPTGVVGLGVMDYHGGYADRERADEVHAEYVAAVTRFADWLIDEGWQVRVLIGDQGDVQAARAVVDAVRARRAELTEPAITVAAPTTLSGVQEEIARVDVVVATRFHNIICALKQAKPTISLAYAPKNDVLMASFGLGDFCQSLGSLDVERLIEQFQRLQERRGELVGAMRVRVAANVDRLDEQFATLANTLFSAHSTTVTRNTT